MASGGKARTTMAKRNRETKLREKRMEKEAKKLARKLAAAQPAAVEETVAPAAPVTDGE
jgi:hypothetical protein